MEYRLPGRYFEEFSLGEQFVTVGRTVTEADIVNFCGVSGDFNPMHTDVEYSKESPMGERVAHGMCGLTIISGSVNRLGLVEGTTLAFLELIWRFLQPIKIGDTITTVFEVTEKRESKKKDRGVMVWNLYTKNQNSIKVQEGKWTILVKRKP